MRHKQCRADDAGGRLHKRWFWRGLVERQVAARGGSTAASPLGKGCNRLCSPPSSSHGLPRCGATGSDARGPQSIGRPALSLNRKEPARRRTRLSESAQETQTRDINTGDTGNRETRRFSQATAAATRRVRGRVLVAQEHQPRPAEPEVHRFDASGSPRVPAPVRRSARRSKVLSLIRVNLFVLAGTLWHPSPYLTHDGERSGRMAPPSPYPLRDVSASFDLLQKAGLRCYR